MGPHCFPLEASSPHTCFGMESPIGSAAAALAAAVSNLDYVFSGILERFGRDLFFVDGDALLALALEEFGTSTDFQLLPAVFRVERALLRLKELGAQFRVFFMRAYGRVGWTGVTLPVCPRAPSWLRSPCAAPTRPSPSACVFACVRVCQCGV